MEELKLVVEYFQNYVADNVSFQEKEEEHTLEGVIGKNLGNFAEIKLNSLKKVVKYIEKRIGRKET